MTYSVARKLDALRGDWSVAGGGFVESPSPGLEMVALVLRTPLGACAADPSFGTDWARVSKVGPRAASDARAVIQAALAGLVRRKVVSVVDVVTEAVDGRIGYAVDVIDLKSGARQTVRGVSP